eukprot:Pgem_evm1s19641
MVTILQSMGSINTTISDAGKGYPFSSTISYINALPIEKKIEKIESFSEKEKLLYYNFQKS